MSPKKLSPEQVAFRQKLEDLRLQYEKGFNGQSKQVETALVALKGVKADIAQIGKYVDDIIKLFEADETGGNGTEEKQEPPTDPPAEKPPVDPLEQELFGEQVVPLETFKIDVFKVDEGQKWGMSMGAARVEAESLKEGCVQLLAYYHMVAESPEALAATLLAKYPNNPDAERLTGYLNPAKAAK